MNMHLLNAYVFPQAMNQTLFIIIASFNSHNNPVRNYYAKITHTAYI